MSSLKTIPFVTAFVVAAVSAIGVWAAASYFGPSVAPFAALLFSGIGTYIASNANKMARHRLTLEFIREYNSDTRVDAARKVMRKFPDMTDSEIVELCVEKDGEERDDMVFLLNTFEILAIGLARGVYDRDLIGLYFGYDIAVLRDKTKVILDACQKKDSLAFCEFEKLAAKINYQYQQK